MSLVSVLERQRQADLVYRASSRIARAAQRNPVSKNKTKQKKTKQNRAEQNRTEQTSEG